jgi:hypothetical protein
MLPLKTLPPFSKKNPVQSSRFQSLPMGVSSQVQDVIASADNLSKLANVLKEIVIKFKI